MKQRFYLMTGVMAPENPALHSLVAQGCPGRPERVRVTCSGA